MIKTLPVRLMRAATLLFTLFAFQHFLPAQADIAPAVLESMAQSPDQQQEVLIRLADQVDCLQLEERFQREGATLQERAYVTITSLQAKAATTQPALLEKLRRLEGVDTESMEAYWIVNAIYCRADARAIRSISEWDGIAGIEPDLEPELLDAEAAPTPSAPIPNGKEPGLAAINAPAMWALGYTGNGTKALVMDSRQEFNHPALRSSYWGHYAPRSQSFTGEEETPVYCGEHGTHVAGIILGLDRRTNDTIGVAFNANWMSAPIAFEECSFLGSVTPSTLSSFQWALNPDDNPNTTDDMPTAINCSWRDGSYTCTGVTANLLAAVESAGIATVWSVGNDGPGSGSVCCASSMALSLVNSFTVGAVNSSNSIAGFSSRGPSQCNNDGTPLSIKPEVSAPGVSIRSAIPEGNYGQLSGTSFSAPYVTGAILLLKEAFPNLAAQDFKMALYMSAVDLGTAGEDNTYGRGIIDVFAAYQYLIDQGHEPVPPVSAEREVAILDARIERPVFCLGELVAEVTFENAGTQPISSLTIKYGANESNLSSYDWTGSLAPGEAATVTLTGLPLNQEGDFTLTVRLEDPNGAADARPYNNVIRRSFEVVPLEYVEGAVVVDFPQPVCAGARVLLRSDQTPADNQRLEWYDDFTGGLPLGTGPSFLTPPVEEDTEFYVDLVDIFSAGKASLEGGNTGIGDLAAGLLFDAFQPFRLKSVTIYPEATGIRIIRLAGPDGQTIQQSTVLISETGEQKVTLNFDVPALNNLVLSLPVGKSLSYNTSGVQYPFQIDGLMRIKRSNGAPTPAGNFFNYYYFFDWEINVPYDCGRTIIPVSTAGSSAFSVNIETEADLVYLSQGGLVDFAAGSPGAVSWNWDFGNGETSSQENPQALFTAPGIYQVSLIATNAAGCSSAALRTIQVVDDVTSVDDPAPDQPALRLFPNPARDQLHLSFAAPLNQRAQVRVLDALGRLTKMAPVANRIEQETTLDISSLPAGIYFLTVDTDNGQRWTGRFVKR